MIFPDLIIDPVGRIGPGGACNGFGHALTHIIEPPGAMGPIRPRRTDGKRAAARGWQATEPPEHASEKQCGSKP